MWAPRPYCHNTQISVLYLDPDEMKPPYLDTRRFWLAVFTSVIICILLAVLFKSRSYDDPFITYRYAENLSTRSGFVYNPGERVQSTTTPLFTLLLAVLSPLWGDLPHLANLIGVISLAAGGLLLWELAAIWKAPWAGWGGLLLYPVFHLAIIPLGSETPLYIALCLGAFAAYLHKNYPVTAACAALAVLTRPDGLLVGMLLAVDFAIWYLRASPKPSVPWRAVLIFLGILLPWFIFAWVYFGSPLPATLAAKQQQGAMAVSQRFFQGLLTILSWYKSWWYVVEAIFALLGLVWVIKQARRWLLFLVWPVLYFIAYSILGVSRYFWYYTPLVPGFLILSGLGLQAITAFRWSHLSSWVNYFSRRLIPEVKFRIQPGPILAGCILAVLLAAQASVLPGLRQPDARYAIYRAAGEWLAAYTPADAAIGALEVGILGYYTHRPMVDFAGLIQPQVVSQLVAGGNYEYAALWAVEHYQPQYLALFPGNFPQLEQGYVAQHCRLKASFSSQSNALKRELDVFECQ
jgi:hypothetical protein